MPFLKLVTLAVLASDIQSPEQLVRGDFNGDRVPDFLFTRSSKAGSTLTTPLFLLGDGNGGYEDRTSSLFSGNVPSVSFIPRVLVSDLNNDGSSDVYAPDFGQDLSPFPGAVDHLWLSAGGNLADRSSTLPQIKTLAHGVSSGDINRDGYTDIVVDNLSSWHEPSEHYGSDTLLIGKRDGTFQESSRQLLPVGLRPESPSRFSHTWSAVTDLTGDGWPDLVLGTWDGALSNGGHFSPASQLLINDGSGSFASSAVLTLPQSPINREIIVWIEPHDLNGDGRMDLLLSVTNGGDASSFYTQGYIQILINNGNGSFRDEVPFIFRPPRVT